jgi:hypothetical protein
MPNAIYHKLPNGDYMNQGYPGGPVYFKVARNPDDNLWYIQFTYNGINWFIHANGQTTPGPAQAQLDAYITNLINGTAGP